MVEKVMSIKNISDIVLSKGYSPTVFITGVTGQDGSLMIDYLLKNTNSWIIGGARRLSVENHANIKHLENEPRFQLVNFDLTDSHSIYKLMETAKPDYFINFAAQSFVASSWDFARQTWQVNSTGVLDCLEAIRKVKPDCRFYNAGSSEEFGNVTYSPQDEKHLSDPVRHMEHQRLQQGNSLKCIVSHIVYMLFKGGYSTTKAFVAAKSL